MPLTQTAGNPMVTSIASPTDDNSVASAFGIKREASTIHPAPQAPTNAPLAASQAPAEGSSPQKVEPSSAKSEPAPSTTLPKEDKEDGKLLQKKASEDHRLIVDMLENQFKMLEKGKLEDKELREWFDEHPDLAEKANRSKRVKDRFRALMERDEAAKYDDEVKSRRALQTRDDEEIDDEEKVSKKSLDGKSLTAADMEKFMEQFEERMAAKQADRARDEELKTFAAQRKIMDDDFKRFSAVTKALTEALPEWAHIQALDAAYRALYPGKQDQVVLPSSGGYTVPEDAAPKLDLTQPTALFDKGEFFGVRKR